MIKQTMMYGSSVWVSTSVDTLNKVFRLQKSATCIILNADTRANSVDLFSELNWVPFFHESKINQCAFERGVSQLYARITQTKHRHTFY